MIAHEIWVLDCLSGKTKQFEHLTLSWDLWLAVFAWYLKTMFDCLHTLIGVSAPLFLQVPDRDLSLYVGLSGHWLGHLFVCGGSSLVSTSQRIQFKVVFWMFKTQLLVFENAQICHRVISSLLLHPGKEIMWKCGTGKF